MGYDELGTWKENLKRVEEKVCRRKGKDNNGKVNFEKKIPSNIKKVI
jgi:hypothetical protein